MAAYSTSFGEGGALQFDRETIEDLARIVKSFLGEDSGIVFEFEAGHKIESKSIDELLSDPYVRSLRIIVIRISGRVYRKDLPSLSINIKIDSEVSFSLPVSISIDGDRDECVATRANLENLLKGCWLWYAKLYRPIGPEYSAARTILGWCASLAVVLAATLLISGLPQTKIELVEILFSSFSFSFGCHYALSFVQKRSFPKLLFNFGKSADQVGAAATWRQVFFGGFLLAITSSIIATVIMNRLNSKTPYGQHTPLLKSITSLQFSRVST